MLQCALAYHAQCRQTDMLQIGFFPQMDAVQQGALGLAPRLPVGSEMLKFLLERIGRTCDSFHDFPIVIMLQSA